MLYPSLSSRAIYSLNISLALVAELAQRERHSRSTYCCCGTPPLLDWCWAYVRAGLYLYTFGLRMCASTRRLPPISPSLAGWPRGLQGKRDLRGCFFFYHPPWQLLGWRFGWKDCCCRWLLLDLLAVSRMLCSVAVLGTMLPTVPDLHRKKKKQAWNEVA